jgi:hypothetical protein
MLLGLKGYAESLQGSQRLKVDSIQTLVAPKDANSKLLAACADLQSVFKDQTGHTLALQSDTPNSLKHAILLQLQASGPREGAFYIKRQSEHIKISSATQDGLVHAIYSLCREVFNARWYWAGDLGLEYIAQPMTHFPEYNHLIKPDFVQRRLWPSDNDFARRNRLVGGFQFNHNLGKIFTPEMFKKHPEAFARIRGHQYTPKGSGGLDPQPKLTSPQAIEIARQAAIDYFNKFPEKRSFSLSINDNTLFDESAETQAAVSPLNYFRGRPNYTDYVFRFMNAVAEQVFTTEEMLQTPAGEPRYLTALAYYWTEEAPTFQLHPRVMPVLTSDRAQWHDPAYRSQDRALIERWANSGAKRIATWDYYFGAPYPYPRQFNQWIAESLQHLHQNGVDVFFSQLPAAWGLDGPKAWLAAELLWDSHQDSQKLLEEYYQHFFGAAAQAMRQFYELAENQRNQTAGTADWIKFYKDPAGIEHFPVDYWQQLRQLIEQAQQAAQQDIRRLKRVEIVSEAFALTECYANMHRARQKLILATINNTEELARDLQYYQEQHMRYADHVKFLENKPDHGRLLEFKSVRQPDPVAMAQWQLAKGNSNNLAKNPYLGRQQLGFNLLKNPDLKHDGWEKRNFLEPKIPKLQGWTYSIRPNQHLQVKQSDHLKQGLDHSGADMLLIQQIVPVKAEQHYLLKAKMAWGVSPDNRNILKLQWRNSAQKTILSETILQLPNGVSDGVRTFEIPCQAPQNAIQLRIACISSRQKDDDFLQLKKIEFRSIQSLNSPNPLSNIDSIKAIKQTSAQKNK